MEILLMIDVQNDFIDGALGTKEAQDMVWRLEDYLENSKCDRIIATMDTHNEDYLDTREGKFLPIPHCIEGTDGWRIPDSIMSKLNGDDIIVTKDNFCSIELTNVVVNVLNDLGERIEEAISPEDVAINVVGLCTDICVLSNVVPIFFNFNENIKIRVLSEFCAGSTPEKHQYSLEILKGFGIEVV